MAAKKGRKRTKIVCTIGPASDRPEVLKKMVGAGMDVARLNFSHGTHEYHAKLISELRSLGSATGQPIAILQDLQGPKVRCGQMPPKGVELEAGKVAVLSTDPKSELPKIPVDYDRLHEDVRAGDRILLDDGLMELRVESVTGREISARVAVGGTLHSHKGINVPTATLQVPAITEKDLENVRFGVRRHVDWVALSFVRTAKEVLDLRYAIRDYESELGSKSANLRPIRIIAKIEKHEAVRNIGEIIEAADGIMVARGDLGVEMPAEEVPLIQKMIIDRCRAASKPVIVATQMLDSMTRNPRPTRAEVSDVANAVIDHTDAVMLSGESASGKYPIESVMTMAKVIGETEASSFDDTEHEPAYAAGGNTEKAVAGLADILSRDLRGTRLILVASLSGDTGRVVSRYRPELPIFVATDSERSRHQLNLSWGVHPFLLPRCRSVEELVDRSINYLKRHREVREGDRIIVVAGDPVGSSGVNLIEIREVK
ncbi:pyruvate kinase [Candidatus Uhrbacteria bacterium]|nr:pyruvate kinase [Candidatus Uhrbacteria bacterium]